MYNEKEENKKKKKRLSKSELEDSVLAVKLAIIRKQKQTILYRIVLISICFSSQTTTETTTIITILRKTRQTLFTHIHIQNIYTYATLPTRVLVEKQNDGGHGIA